uniref:Envelope protein n=1 Tax=Aquila chrysaetos chrysaetos TaxID=223781 RepID=A0A663DN89_AQUCH
SSITHLLYLIWATVGTRSVAWNGNMFVKLHESIAKIVNQTDCWICSHFPKGLGQGYPIIATVFSNTSVIAAAFNNMSLTKYTEIPPENLQWQTDLSELWNETQRVPCVQRCHLKNTTKNSGGNSTDPKCGSVKLFVGSYPNCTEYIRYGGANMWNFNQTRVARTRGHNSITPGGWPTPVGLGWYWICGQTGYKVLPLGWTGQCAVGTIAPNTIMVKNLTGHDSQNFLRTYMKPVISFVRWLIPSLGVSELEKALVNLSATMEIINNATIDAIKTLQEGNTSLGKMVLQNRLGLDMLFAQQGGLCTVFNECCCTYVNEKRRIETDLSQIWKQTQLLHLMSQDDTSWEFTENGKN